MKDFEKIIEHISDSREAISIAESRERTDRANKKNIRDQRTYFEVAILNLKVAIELIKRKMDD